MNPVSKTAILSRLIQAGILAFIGIGTATYVADNAASIIDETMGEVVRAIDDL